MSKVRVTLEDGKDKQVLILNKTTIDEAIDTLASEPDEIEIIETFLMRNKLELSALITDSSWINEIRFDANTDLIKFVSEDGAIIPFDSSLEKFIEDLNEPSYGQLHWKYKRGER